MRRGGKSIKKSRTTSNRSAVGNDRETADTVAQPAWEPATTRGPEPYRINTYEEGNSLIEKVRIQWQLGDWHALTSHTEAKIVSNQHRANLALFVASGFAQLGEFAQSRNWLRLAIDWGAGKDAAARLLIAGTHNSLGRIATILEDSASAQQHFEMSIKRVFPNTDSNLLAHSRSVYEMGHLGLLDQASRQLLGLLEIVENPARRTNAHIKVLEIEVHWIRARVLAIESANFVKKKSLAASAPQEPSKTATSKTYHGLNELDRKLEAYITWENGFFVELGANDGIQQSNTLYYERDRNWNGILIEPILHNYLKCKSNRSDNNFYYCGACVSFSYDKPYVVLDYSNLMTTPIGVEGDILDPHAHAGEGKKFLSGNEEIVEVYAKAITLQNILIEARAPKIIDMLSLDVEGGEIEVLKGIDHSQYRFKFILIESRRIEIITDYLNANNYRLIDQLSHHDYLFESTDTP